MGDDDNAARRPSGGRAAGRGFAGHALAATAAKHARLAVGKWLRTVCVAGAGPSMMPLGQRQFPVAAWYCSTTLAGMRPRSLTARPWPLAQARISLLR